MSAGEAGGAAKDPAADTAGPPVFCDHCGERLGDAVHGDCARMRQLEPPRYCPQCRRRMVVQVVPRGWVARCVEHGVTAAQG